MTDNKILICNRCGDTEGPPFDCGDECICGGMFISRECPLRNAWTGELVIGIDLANGRDKTVETFADQIKRAAKLRRTRRMKGATK